MIFLNHFVYSCSLCPIFRQHEAFPTAGATVALRHGGRVIAFAFANHIFADPHEIWTLNSSPLRTDATKAFISSGIFSKSPKCTTSTGECI